MYHFIINPHSRTGKGLKVWELAAKELAAQKVPYEKYFTQYEFHAAEIANDICTRIPGVKKIIVVGGDGTLNEVINGIPDFDDVLLGYIPSGSSNDFARSLKLPKDPVEGLKHILSPTNFKYVDVGEIQMDDNKFRKFAVSTGTGFDAAICDEVFHSRIKSILNHVKLGKFTYIVIAIKQLLTAPFITADVTVDGKLMDSYDQVLLITSMIHKYEGGGMKIVPFANPFDHKLSVCIVYGLSRLKILFLLPTLLIGKHIYFKGVKTFHCSSLEIKAKAPAKVHVDGEYPGAFEHLHICCSSKQLRIIN